MPARHLRRNWLRLAALVSAFAVTSASAAILGFHDISDPLKTLGWACSTTDATPVRVHLYAEVDGALKLLDTQLADKRRDDLAAVCGGTTHAFRFSDYARTPEGIALYGNTGPVRIHVFVEDHHRPAIAGRKPALRFVRAGGTVGSGTA